MQQRTELESVLSVGDDGSVSARAQIVLWWDEGRSAADIAGRAGTTRPIPKGSSWINQIETWFGVITRQAIRRGSFRSLAELIKRIDTYITHWNEDTTPFEWTATADEIIAKVALLDRDYRKLVANNIK